MPYIECLIALINVVRNQKEVTNMKLLKINKPAKRPTLIPQKPVKPRKSTKGNTLPPDTYEDEFEPVEIPIDETRKLVFSVRRGGEFGLPDVNVDIRQYQTTEVYEGFTKKGFHVPVEMIEDLQQALEVVKKECKKRKLIE